MEKAEFNIKPTAIPGLLEIEISVLEDSRGYFQEKFQKEKLVAAGFPGDFIPVQQNISFNKEAGTTRGLHAEPWDKYVSIVSGKVFAAFVDLRKENFGKKVEVTIDAAKAVFVPRGVANSYQTLEPNTFYSYLVNAYWSAALAAEYKSVNVADSDLGINWPIDLTKALLSDKDKANPFLKTVQPF